MKLSAVPSDIRWARVRARKAVTHLERLLQDESVGAEIRLKAAVAILDATACYLTPSTIPSESDGVPSSSVGFRGILSSETTESDGPKKG